MKRTNLSTEDIENLEIPKPTKTDSDFEGRFLNFQEQVSKDLDSIFFNADAKEFVTSHTIGGLTGMPSVECNIVVDYELYKERVVKDNIESISYNGLIFFIKKDIWTELFKRVPKAEETLLFDDEQYEVESVQDDMGILEFTLTGKRGW